MKERIKENAWILMCVLMIVFCAVAYQIVDAEPVGAYEVTEMTPEDIAEEMYWDDLENLALCTMAGVWIRQRHRVHPSDR